MSSARVPCKVCGVEIQTGTAARLGGLCMPCNMGNRSVPKDFEQVRRRWDRQVVAHAVGRPTRFAERYGAGEREVVPGDARLQCWLAPDQCHKANYSGGEDYQVVLPEPAVDFPLVGRGLDGIAPPWRTWIRIPAPRVSARVSFSCRTCVTASTMPASAAPATRMARHRAVDPNGSHYGASRRNYCRSNTTPSQLRNTSRNGILGGRGCLQPGRRSRKRSVPKWLCGKGFQPKSSRKTSGRCATPVASSRGYPEIGLWCQPKL